MSDADATTDTNSGWPSQRMLGIAISLGLLCGVLLLAQGLQPSDDAYITFRHARHLALHGWPAWNLTGPPVLGSTSPAWMFWLGGLGALFGGGRIETLALASNAGLTSAIVVLSFLVAYDLLEDAFSALVAAALVGVNSVCVYVYSLGFEAAGVSAVVLACLLALRRDRRRTAVFLASLAPLVRPEGVLLTPIVWGVLLLRGHASVRLVAWFAALPLVWAVAASAFYGSPVPHSITAKQNFPRVYRPYTGENVSLIDRLPTVPAATLRVWQRRLEPALFQGRLQSRESSARDRLQAWLAYLGLLGLIPRLRRGERFAYALYPLGFVVLHGWLGALTIWYLPSFVGLATLLGFAGATRLLQLGSERLGLQRMPRRAVVRTGVVTLFALFATSNQYGVRADGDASDGRWFARDARGPRWEQWERERFDGYRAAALALNAREADNAAKAGASALISEVGVFGFFYDGAVIDAVGICSPEALGFYPPPRSDLFDAAGAPYTTANNIVPSRMITELEPAYVVGSLTYLEHLIRPGTLFLKTYTRLRDVGRAWDRPIALYGRTPEDAPASRR